jgi:hypothetical protein
MSTLVDRRQDLSGKVTGGVIGGLLGGIVFGAMMSMLGMIPMIASMVGSQSAVVGWLIHLAISIFIGVTFAWIFGARSATYGSGLLWGAIYGIVWWVLGPLLIMPAMMGMPLFQFNSVSMMSLIGHIIYGALLGFGYAWYASRA